MILNNRYLYNTQRLIKPRPLSDIYSIVNDHKTFKSICRDKSSLSKYKFDYLAPLHTQEEIIEDACRFELVCDSKPLYLYQGYFKLDDYIHQKIKEVGKTFSIELECINIQNEHISLLFRGDDNYVLYACQTSHPMNKEKVYIDAIETSGGTFVKVRYSSGYYYEEML